MSVQLEGVAELTRKLKELADPKQQASALRESVAKPMREVAKVARTNIARISPGKAELHKTYRGRLVSAGFASRSIRVKTRLSRDKQAATATLGVLAEAFYAVQFFEFGTAKIAKQPWLLPAYYSSKDKMLRGVGDVLKARIEKIAKGRGK